MRLFARVLAIAAALGALATCAPRPTSVGEEALGVPPPPLQPEQALQVPMTDAIGQILSISARVCRPDGKGPFPLAVLNHGAAQPGQSRADMRPTGCDSPAAQWFLARDYIVLIPLRRGYGDTGTGWAADPGSCESPDYVRSGIEAARDIAATVVYLERSNEVKRSGLVVMGEDEGGWAALAYGSVQNPALAAVIDVDGGMGGRAASETGHVCRPDLLIDAAGQLGQTSRVRTLWIYPVNDSVYPPDLAQPMFAAFRAAGGVGEFAAPAVPGGSHAWMFTREGEEVWSPLVEKFLGH